MTASTLNTAMEDPFRDVTVRRSLLGQALYDTFGQTGAKLGMIWIGTLAILAVLAPFLASSYPILLRLRGGTMTSPLLQSLEAIDVILLVLLLYSICVLAYRLPAGTTIACILWPLFTTSIPLLVIRYGPPLVRFRLYRPESLDGAGFTQVNPASILLATLPISGQSRPKPALPPLRFRRSLF